MKIEFKNGSSIKVIESETESVRGKRSETKSWMDEWERALLNKEMMDEILQPFMTNREPVEPDEDLPDQVIYVSYAERK